MGCLCTKADGRNQAEEVTDLSRNNHPKAPCVDDNIIFLHNFDFNARLELNKSGPEGTLDEYVLRCVEDNGLAYNAGFRNGDVLLEVNGENIEGSGIEHVLELLCQYKDPNVFLDVKRDGPTPKYIWVIFAIVVKDGVQTVEVQQTLENDEYKSPFRFDRESLNKYDIYVELSPSPPPTPPPPSSFYLAIDNGQALFRKRYNVEKSSFYKYYYTGNSPDEGVAVVYSLQDLGKKNVSNTDEKSTPSGTAEDELKVLDMPSYMGRNLIRRSNPRFWFEKKTDENGELEKEVHASSASSASYVNLKSVNAPGDKYLAVGEEIAPSEVRRAILLPEPMTVTVASS